MSQKPVFRAPERSPMKVADTIPPPQERAPAQSVPMASAPDGWQPISSAPKEKDAVFWVRVVVKGKSVSGTETLVRYRLSRKMVGGRWVGDHLVMIDDRLRTKLGFVPNEWKPEAGKRNG